MNITKYVYCANVSGGKDSLFMLKHILSNLDRYRLNFVVHYELEIDYPFIKNVIDFMESECKKFNIPFYRIKPTNSWYELYDKYGYPTRKVRWCNSKYKLDCAKQINAHYLAKGIKVIHYIGYCVDEYNRYSKRNNQYEIYPLVNDLINESTILEWARHLPIYNDYYKYNKRCGCMFCPMSKLRNFAYLLKYYPNHYNTMISLMRDTEYKRSLELGRPFSCTQSNGKYGVDYLDNIVKSKYVKLLNYELLQGDIFDFVKN